MLNHMIAELSRRQPTEATDSGRPQAAVAVLLAEHPDQVLLIRRAERADDPWSGQLALPGGRRHATDTDLLETAIRETAEETGIDLDRAWYATQLDDLAPQTPTLPPIVVRPFVFRLQAAVVPGVSNEVARAMWLPLAHLAADGVYAEREIVVHGATRLVDGYAVEEGVLWGMTARIVSPIILLWKDLQSPDSAGGGLIPGS